MPRRPPFASGLCSDEDDSLPSEAPQPDAEPENNTDESEPISKTSTLDSSDDESADQSSDGPTDEPPPIEPQPGVYRRTEPDDDLDDDFGAGLFDEAEEEQGSDVEEPADDISDASVPEPRQERFEDDSSLETWADLADEDAPAEMASQQEGMTIDEDETSANRNGQISSPPSSWRTPTKS